MHAYGGKHSDRQIETLPIPNESHFAKLNGYTHYMVNRAIGNTIFAFTIELHNQQIIFASVIHARR